MIITCPYCSKKMYASGLFLVFKGRLRIACPACKRQVYAAMKKELLFLQIAIGVLAVLFGIRLGGMDLPGGLVGKTAALLLLIVCVYAILELLSRWVTRNAILQQRTARYRAKEQAREEQQKAEARMAQKKNRKKAKR